MSTDDVVVEVQEQSYISPRNISLVVVCIALLLVECLGGSPFSRPRALPSHAAGGLGIASFLHPSHLSPAAKEAEGQWHFLRSQEALKAAGSGAVLASVPAWVFSPTPGGERTTLQEGSFWDAHAVGAATAQDGEDEYAYMNFFFGSTSGTILESGALDGVTYSVSRFFVYARGWRAVHVEGSPTSYAALAVNRPEALNIHTALCNVSRTLHYAVNPAVPATSGFWEFIPAWIRSGFYAGVDVDEAKMPLVPCRPLGPLLEMYGVRKINLWVLDVEGAEEEVLTSVDFSRLSVDVIVAELDGGNEEKDARCHDILIKAGFVYHAGHRIVRNKWYVHKDFVPSVAPQTSFELPKSSTLRRAAGQPAPAAEA